MSATAKFRFHGSLEGLLERGRRGVAFDYACARAASLKNAVEALGVPHTEIGWILVNDVAATLDRTVRPGDVVEVFSWPEGAAAVPEGERRFLADAHLGGLARLLRMLGFDTLHGNALADADVRRLARSERRIVLTRDRALLMCRDIAHGCLVRAQRAEAQLQEVALRYALAAAAQPFSRCLCCNLPLDRVAKAAIAARLPEQVRARHEHFMACHGCDRIYWPGSHYARMRAALARIALPAAD